MIGKNLHINEPLGSNGLFDTTQSEEARVRQNLRAILLIDTTEWPMRQDRGTPIQNSIYSLNDVVSFKILETVIKSQIARFEPHLQVVSVDVDSVEDNQLLVSIHGILKRTNAVLTFSARMTFK